MAGLLAGPASACRLALLLALDVSSSVNGLEYDLQRRGLAAALNSEDVRHAILRGAPGAVASNVVLSRETLSTDFALADLDGDADLREVIATAEARILDLPPDPDSDPEAAE